MDREDIFSADLIRSDKSGLHRLLGIADANANSIAVKNGTLASFWMSSMHSGVCYRGMLKKKEGGSSGPETREIKRSNCSLALISFF